MTKENFNFIDVESLLNSGVKMDELPLGQIRISKFALYIPKWMMDENYCRLAWSCKRYPLQMPRIHSVGFWARGEGDGISL